MSLILPPFHYRRAIALSLDYLLLNKLQSLQLILKDGHQSMLILFTIEVNNGSCLTYSTFFKAQHHAIEYILLCVEHLPCIDDV